MEEFQIQSDISSNQREEQVSTHNIVGRSKSGMQNNNAQNDFTSANFNYNNLSGEFNPNSSQLIILGNQSVGENTRTQHLINVLST